MSIITNVNGVATKMTAMHAAMIGRNAIALVSTRGTVDSRGLITSGGRSGTWPCNYEGRWRIGNDTSRKRRRRRRGV